MCVVGCCVNTSVNPHITGGADYCQLYVSRYHAFSLAVIFNKLPLYITSSQSPSTR